LKKALSAATKREEATAQREAAATMREDRLNLAIRDLNETVASLKAYLLEEQKKNVDLVCEVHLWCFVVLRLYSIP
jgi:hypothetical protein